MRINRYVAEATGMSRRTADKLIHAGRVIVNGRTAEAGYRVMPDDAVQLDDRTLTLMTAHRTVMMHKPVGYVCSRAGQGSRTVYDLLPAEFGRLKPIGRLDKYTSGLLLLTSDGELAHRLTHPSHEKVKIYEIRLDKPLADSDRTHIRSGVPLEDGSSRLRLNPLDGGGRSYEIRMHEGRNRQIRRTFAALGYHVEQLHRTALGGFSLGQLPEGAWIEVKNML